MPEFGGIPTWSHEGGWLDASYRLVSCIFQQLRHQSHSLDRGRSHSLCRRHESSCIHVHTREAYLPARTINPNHSLQPSGAVQKRSGSYRIEEETLPLA